MNYSIVFYGLCNDVKFICNCCGLVGPICSIMMICLIDYVKYDHIYQHASYVKVCALLWILSDHVGLCLCVYVCSLKVDI